MTGVRHGGDRKKVTIVGGGLVGSLNALYFGQEGYQVDVYEGREDCRIDEGYAGRSINLALSVRGIEALKKVGLADQVVSTGLKMTGRMIHNRDGSKVRIPYGKPGQGILSIDRQRLNQVLIAETEKHPFVNFHFKHKLESCNVETGEATFMNTVDGEKQTVQSDLLVGNDGAYSRVRKEMMRRPLFNYQQEYIPHGYKELTIPAGDNDAFRMEPDALHIWPREEFMMIALPNQDKTFTCTLFMPFEMFEEIESDADIMRFFTKYFDDSIPLIGKDRLLMDYRKNETSHLVSVKCSPWHVKDKAVIMGDAAHAMVPFYGQGMNCGFEDILEFHATLEKNKGDLAMTLESFSQYRPDDAHAICDLAMYNYIEMRLSVNSLLFRARKNVDGLLHSIMPEKWVPLYSMVTFSRRRYSEVVQRAHRQDEIIENSIIACAGLAVIGVLGYGVRRLLR
eukprot:Clim_evm76s236 gene=Clim_evmTU76s236